MSCKNTLNPIDIGATVPIGVVITDKETGDPVDITGSTVTLTLKEKKEDPDPGALQKDAVLSNPTQGEALFTLSVAETSALEEREYYYSVKWTDISGNVSYLKFDRETVNAVKNA